MNRALVAALTLAALAARLVCRIDYVEDIDSDRFVRALEEGFDVAAYRPHFPGYPVFMLLGRLALPLCGGDGVLALAVVSAAAGAALVPLSGVLAGRLWGERAILLGAAFAAVNPLLWVQSQTLLSDSTGLALVAGALALVPRAPGCFLAGLALGARLSYFPLAASALLLVRAAGRPLAPAVAWLGAGVLAWVVPLVALTGPGPLLEVGLVQGSGHFTDWGGSVATDPDALARLGALAWQLAAHGLGTWWPDRAAWLLAPTLALGALVALGARGLPRRSPWLAVALPYLVWIALGQNVLDKPRHALPVVAALAVLLAGVAARALARAPRLALGAAGLCLGAQAALGWGLARAHAATPSTPVQLARALAGRCGAAPVLVYTAGLERHLRREAPCVQAIALRRLGQVRRDLATRPAGAEVWVVSDVSRFERLGEAGALSAARSRYLPGPASLEARLLQSAANSTRHTSQTASKPANDATFTQARPGDR